MGFMKGLALGLFLGGRRDNGRPSLPMMYVTMPAQGKEDPNDE
jgi:hypothetical protein